MNAWKFGDIMIDSGVSSTKSWDVLQPHADVDALLLTHGHVDHAGNAHRFEAPVYAGAGEESNIETFRAEGASRNDDYAKALRWHGMPEEPLRTIRASEDAVDKFTEDTTLSGTLHDGQIIGDLQVIATPGHTAGSVCFLHENQLVTGDTLLERITSNAVELRNVDKGRFHQYVETIRGLERFVDCECLPGHHTPFPITHDVIHYHVDSHERRAKRIQSILKEPMTAWQIMRQIFPGLQGPGPWFMGMAEVVGHLHRLEILEEISMKNREGVRYFA